MPASVRLETDASGVATVWFDVPGKSVNPLSGAVLEDLDAAVRALEASPPAGVVFASAKPATFIAGADLFEMRSLDDASLETFLARGQGLLDRIAALPVTTVAALGGDALGGGYELALACDVRIVADEPRIRIGLPETTLGILPGWGGTIRLPRLVGLEAGLKLLVTGRTVGPAEAVELGMVDERVPAACLLEEARRRALGPGGAGPRPGVEAAADPETRRTVFARFRDETRRRSGDHLPAPLRVIDVVDRSYEDGLEAAAVAERRELLALRGSPAGRNLMRLFFLRNAARKTAAARAGGTPRQVTRAAVIGGGTMGAGIAEALARAGIAVQVVEADEPSAAAAAARIAAAGGTVPVVADWAAVPDADLVVEAVVERLPVKLDVFRRLDALVRPDAVLATNTSSLSVAAIAAATARPERVVGMHFFNPVAKMPLVEVVRTPRSDADAVATAVTVAGRAGKTPVLVNDAPGFVVNRVLFPSLREAAVMFEEGVSVVAADAALRAWGLPMGPFTLMDEIGLDVSLMILESLQAALGNRFAPPAVLQTAVARGWLGRKAGRGFLRHPPDGRPVPNEELAVPAAAAAIADAVQIQRRIVEPMAAEARLVLAEGVVDSADAIDLATVLGLGFAPFRGGLATFAGLA